MGDKKMTNAEITEIVEWAESTAGEPTADDGCRTCGYAPCDAVHLTLPHRHAYVDPRPLAMLALVGRQLLDERDAAVLKRTRDVFALKCDNESLATQLRLRTSALADLTADVERGRFEDRALQVENERLQMELMDYQDGDAVRELAADREIYIREMQRLSEALSNQGKGIARLCAERDRARILNLELVDLASQAPSNERDRRIEEIAALDGALPEPTRRMKQRARQRCRTAAAVGKAR